MAERTHSDGQAGIRPGGAMPERLTLATHDHRADPAGWLARFPGVATRDIYASQVAELAEVRLPGGSPQELLALLARTRGQRLAVIGHQPDLGRLIASCLPGSAASAAFELRKMAVALIAFHGSPRVGQGELHWLVPPKLLRAIR